MAKESRKCDSLRVAYGEQYATLQELVSSNLKYFERMQNEEKKRETLQKDLEESTKALRKKKNSWILPTSIGSLSGLVFGLLIAN